MRAFLYVWLGGGFGAISRYYLGQWIMSRWTTVFPYGTFVINITGCLILGFFATLAALKATAIPNELRLLIAVGFVGAYTTFSTYCLETVKLIENGHGLVAATYSIISVPMGLAAVYAGIAAARLFG